MPDDPKPDEQIPRGLSEAETEAVFQRLLKQRAGGDPENLAQKLLRETLSLRAKLADAQAAGTPKDHVALPKADADLLAAYKALGTPAEIQATADTLGQYKALGEPAAIKAAVEELPVLKDTLVKSRRAEQLNKLAELRGYSTSVLGRPGVADGMEFVVAKVTDEKTGEETESIEVKDTDDKGKPRTRKIEEVEAAEWKDLMPALRPGEAGKGHGDRERGSVTRRELPIGTGGYHGDERPRRTVADRSRPPEKPQVNHARVVAGGI